MASGEVVPMDGEDALTLYGDIGTVGQMAQRCIELFVNQFEVSQYLQLAYMQGIKNVEVTTKVRKDAHEARTLHLTSVDLMRQFFGTSSNVLKKIVPGMRLGIKKKNEKLVRKFFSLMVEWSEKMRVESINTRDKYKLLQGQISTHVSDVKGVKEDLDNKRKRDEAGREKEAKKRAGFTKEEKELEERKKKLEGEAKKAGDQYTELITEVNKAESKREKGGIIKGLMPEVENQKVNIAVSALDRIASFVPDLISKFMDRSKLKTAETLIEHKGKLIQETTKVDQMKHDMAQKNIESEHAMTLLNQALASNTVVDANYLDGAASCLSKVETSLNMMIEFWSMVTAALKHLAESGEAADPLLEFMEDDDILEELVTQVGDVELGWKEFGKACNGYLEASVKSKLKVDNLYKFLGGSVEELSEEQRHQEIKKLEAITQGSQVLQIESGTTN